MNTKVLIIGGGQIGSRHLQGILKSNYRLTVTIIDPNLESLKRCKNRSQYVKFGNSLTTVSFKKDIPKDEKFEICIISTNSDIRAKITRELLKSCSTRYIIFEKILFQINKDYDDILKLLKKNQVKAWVNCPKRTHAFYKEIKKTLDLSEPFKMNIIGSSWGMACNSIHYIDLFSFFVNNTDLSIVRTDFSNRLVDSKRGKHLKDINGLIEYKIKNHALKIICQENSNRYLHIEIKNKEVEFYIDETNCEIESKVNGKVQVKKFSNPQQSNMSKKLIEKLITEKKCDLVSFEESCGHHLMFISEIRKHMSKILKKELVVCPIT